MCLITVRMRLDFTSRRSVPTTRRRSTADFRHPGRLVSPFANSHGQFVLTFRTRFERGSVWPVLEEDGPVPRDLDKVTALAL